MGLFRALAVAAIAAGVAGPALADEGVVGTWATEGGKSHVEISRCGSHLCGEIVWLQEPNDAAGKPKVDRNNPDQALRDRPIIGLPLLNGFVAGSEPGTWEDGTIYNPEDGETYSCTMTLLDDGRLRVRGYVGLPIFGKSQVWTRVSGG